MTSNESQVSSKAPLAHLIYIYIVDGTPMLVSHKGTSSPAPPPPCPPICSLVTPIPKLSLNFLSIGQIYELGIGVLFTDHGVNKQDP